MKCRRPLSSDLRATAILGIAASLLVTSLPGRAATFTPGDIYWAAGDCSIACEIFDVTAGGDFTSATGLATITRSPGQIAWSLDGTTLYVTEFSLDRVSAVSTTGVVTTFASGIDAPTGLIRMTTGRILVASFNDHAVYDITPGGDFSAASPWASGLSGPRNLIERQNGDVLVANQSAQTVVDISGGGNTPFASGLPFGSPLDLLEDGSGNLYTSTGFSVLDITAGGDFTGASAFADGQDFTGLTLSSGGAILASEFFGDIYDISAGGDFSAATPFAENVPEFADSALDTVPPAPVPAAGPGALGVLGVLLAVGGGLASRRRSARRSRRVA